MKIEKFNEEFKKYKREVNEYLTNNVLDYSCDQKAINDLNILLDRFLNRIGVKYPNDFSIKCEFVPEYYFRYDYSDDVYRDLTEGNSIKISFYCKDKLIETTNSFYTHAFPLIDMFNININCD